MFIYIYIIILKNIKKNWKRIQKKTRNVFENQIEEKKQLCNSIRKNSET